jgi:hypothetical protein
MAVTLTDIAVSLKGRFLMLGKCDAELSTLKAAGWSGVAASQSWGALKDDDYYGSVTFIDGMLHYSAQFTQTMQGTWVKPVTPQEIMDQFGDPKFDLVLINVEMMTRYLWYLPQIQDHLPRYYVISDDGHSEDAIQHAKDRGYWVHRAGEWLIMRHRRAGEAEILTEAEKKA